MSRRSSTGSDGTRLLHLDCFSGMAGNMFMGALLDAGLSRKQLSEDLAGLGLDYKLVVRNVQRGALAARYVDVRVPRARKHHHGPGRHAQHHHGRSHAEIVKVLEKARLDGAVRERALDIYRGLAEAEAKVHGIPVAKVHFHEVGAVDAIVDVTAAAVGVARLGVTRVTSSPVALGEGFVETDHGRLPLPAPATLELLRGVPTVPAHIRWETVTPTGAAILRSLVDEYTALPAMTLESIGYGAGNEREGPLPNVLRVVLGRASVLQNDRVVVLEAHLDDLNPEYFDHLMERLFETGALDVSIYHLQMKKNRPGFALRVVARPSERLPLANLLFAESTTLGVRVAESDRLVLPRALRRVDTLYGRIAVKVATDDEGRERMSAEYDDCKKAARRHGVPLRDVVRAAEEAARA
jgi:uncharacterized protein (TIGR00299 family) protein